MDARYFEIKIKRRKSGESASKMYDFMGKE